jgi:hypothetical protein
MHRACGDQDPRSEAALSSWRRACPRGAVRNFSEDDQVTRTFPRLTAAAAFAGFCLIALPAAARADTLRPDSLGPACSGVCAVADTRLKRPRVAARKPPIRHGLAAEARILVPEATLRVPSRYVSLLILGVAY